MDATHIRMAVRSFYADIWNRHDKSRIAALIHEDFNFRGSLGQTRHGHDGFASYVDFVHEALGDYHCDLLDLVIEPPKAFARMRFSGVHRGPFFSYPPTWKKIEWAGAALFYFREDRIADLWVLGDVHALLQQLERNADH